MAEKKTLTDWLTTRYLLIIRNEENFAEKRTLRFNYSRVLLLLFAGFLVNVILAIFVVTVVLEQWLDPRYAQSQTNKRIIQLSQNIDTLELQIRERDAYLLNLKKILDGSIADSIVLAEPNSSFDKSLPSHQEIEKFSEVDSVFRARYEKDSKNYLAVSPIRSLSDENEDLFLFTPLTGVITQKFDPLASHFGTDIVSKENTPILAVADGIVVFSSWTLDGGFEIIIQHKGDLLSVYKHNSELLKTSGQKVKIGEIIAIIGNTGELTTGPHLHFELWYNGSAINPENFFTFD